MTDIETDVMLAEAGGELHVFEGQQPRARCGEVERGRARLSEHRTDIDAIAVGASLCPVCSPSAGLIAGSLGVELVPVGARVGS